MPGTQPGSPADQLAAPGLCEAPGSLAYPRPHVPAWPLAPSTRHQGCCLASSFPETSLPSAPSQSAQFQPPPRLVLLPPLHPLRQCRCLAILLFQGRAQCGGSWRCRPPGSISGAPSMGESLLRILSSAGVSCSLQGPGARCLCSLLEPLPWGPAWCQGPVKGGTLVSVLSMGIMPSVPDLCVRHRSNTGPGRRDSRSGRV